MNLPSVVEGVAFVLGAFAASRAVVRWLRQRADDVASDRVSDEWIRDIERNSYIGRRPGWDKGAQGEDSE